MSRPHAVPDAPAPDPADPGAADRVRVRAPGPEAAAPGPGEPETAVRVRLDLAYDGRAFHGWAAQPGLDTVQGALEEALATIVRRPVGTVVAGRTDAGVHARGQVVHLDLSEDEWAALTRGRPGLEPGSSLVRRLGGVLSRWDGAVAVRAATRAPEGFDARFSALWREYSYLVHDRPEGRDPLTRGHVLWHRTPLDVALMAVEADGLLGLHDFLSFCKPRAGATTIRRLQAFTVQRREDGMVEFRVRADAFCHSMVRSLVAAVLMVGERARPPGWARTRLEEPVRDAMSRLAPPHPLVLEEVGYPDAAEDPGAFAARAEGTRARRSAAELGEASAGA